MAVTATTESVLKRLKLVDHLVTEVAIDKKDFVERLKANVDAGSTSQFFASLEMFSSSKNEYKGLVTDEHFKIRRRRRLFDVRMSVAVAEGTFKARENLLVIESTIRGFNGIFIPFIVFALIFYLLFIVTFIFTDSPGIFRWLIIPLVMIHAFFMIGFPYFIMRRSISRMKYELERDFHYMAR